MTGKRKENITAVHSFISLWWCTLLDGSIAFCLNEYISFFIWKQVWHSSFGLQTHFFGSFCRKCSIFVFQMPAITKLALGFKFPAECFLLEPHTTIRKCTLFIHCWLLTRSFVSDAFFENLFWSKFSCRFRANNLKSAGFYFLQLLYWCVKNAAGR